MPTRYEAENALSVGGTTYSNTNGVDGYVKMTTSSGDYLEWSNVVGGTGGVCLLTLSYALGKNGMRDCAVTVNGVYVDDFYIPRSLAWNDWVTSMLAVPCNAGSDNVIRVTGGSNGGPAIDYLEVAPNPVSTVAGRYEAEHALRNVSGTTFSNTNGVDGYVKMSTTPGEYIEWSNVNGGAGGTCTLDFRYALGKAGRRDCDVSVNGFVAGMLTIPWTEGWSNWVTLSLAVPCNAGSSNVVRLIAGSNGGPAIDYLQVTSN